MYIVTDILLNFRTTYVNRKGEVVSDWKSISYNYLRTWFIVDFFAALPFDLHALFGEEVFKKYFCNIIIIKINKIILKLSKTILIIKLK